MGIWNMLKQHAGAQFLELIEWLDDTNNTLVWRFPVFNQAITDNSKLVVREGQAAVFVSEGRLSDVFGPGSYDLDTKNKAILSFFTSIAYNFNYPYKGDVYFVSTRQFTDNGWGTPNPIMMRDAEFGPVRIRAFGAYSYRITDPALFMKQIVGTDGLFTTDEINGQLKKKLVSMLADTIGKSKIPVLDLAANYMDLGDTMAERINPKFSEMYGITLTDFTISNISLPEAVEKAMDERSKMGVLGNLNAYTQLKSAEAIGTAAANPGLAGAGIGMGMGMGMGAQMGAQMAAGQQSGQFNPHQGMTGPPSPAPPPPPPSGGTPYHYSGAGGQQQLPLAQVVAKIQADPNGTHNVWQPGWAGWKSWKECAEIMAKMPPAPPPAPPSASYHYNGDAGQSEKTLAEVIAAVQASPSGAHHVWQNGWAAWKPAKEVAEIASKLSSGPPPPPPM